MTLKRALAVLSATAVITAMGMGSSSMTAFGKSSIGEASSSNSNLTVAKSSKGDVGLALTYEQMIEWEKLFNEGRIGHF